MTGRDLGDSETRSGGSVGTSSSYGVVVHPELGACPEAFRDSLGQDLGAGCWHIAVVLNGEPPASAKLLLDLYGGAVDPVRFPC
eukprot:2805483-Rhodomonas_salina.6